MHSLTRRGSRASLRAEPGRAEWRPARDPTLQPADPPLQFARRRLSRTPAA